MNALCVATRSIDNRKQDLIISVNNASAGIIAAIPTFMIQFQNFCPTGSTSGEFDCISQTVSPSESDDTTAINNRFPIDVVFEVTITDSVSKTYKKTLFPVSISAVGQIYNDVNTAFLAIQAGTGYNINAANVFVNKMIVTI